MLKHRLFRQFEVNSPLDSPLDSSRRAQKKQAQDFWIREEKSISDSDSEHGDHESDTESGSESVFHSTIFKHKLPYTSAEDEWILRFVLKGQNIFKVGSVLMWKHLEAKKGNPKRTYQSLKNRFLRNIRPHLFTKYSHLIKEDKLIEKILTKFPELKPKVGKTNTLSGLNLPARRPTSRDEQNGTESGPREIGKRTTPPRLPAPAPAPDASGASPNGLRPPGSLNLKLFHLPTFKRKVATKDKSVVVTVDFNSKKRLEDPFPPSLGMYEKYKKLKTKNKLILCTSCGRYNRPRGNKSVNLAVEESFRSTQSDVLVADSVEVRENSSGCSKERESDKGSKSSSCKSRKMSLSEKSFREHPDCRPSSPSLLDGAGREADSGADGVDQAGEESRKEADPSPEVWSRDLEDLEAYEDTVSDFRKLITDEEERVLVKKCLFGSRKILGFDSGLEMNTDSFFVELSQNLETPEISTDFSERSESDQSEEENSGTSLARNMMKMLGRELKFNSS